MNAHRPGDGASQDRELPRGYERSRGTLNASCQPRISCTQSGDILGIEEFSAATCPACGAADDITRNARLCHRAGAQLNQYQPSVHAASRFLKRMSVRHQVESGAPFFIAVKDLRMGIVIEKGGLRDASASEFRHKGKLIDATYADSQAGGSPA